MRKQQFKEVLKMFRTLSEDKIFKREARLLLKDLNPPEIVTTNVSYWRPFGHEERYLREVYKWLEELNLRLGLDLKIVREGDTINVYSIKEQVAYFALYKNEFVHRRQDFGKLLSYIEQKLKEMSLKPLSTDEEMFYRALSKILGISWEDPTQAKMLVGKWDFFVFPLVSKVKFRDEDEIIDFLRTTNLIELRTADLNKLLNYINVLNITNYKRPLFVVFRKFRNLVSFKILVELAKIIEEKNLDPESVRFWFSTRGKLGYYPDIYKIFIEFLRGVRDESDLRMWHEVIDFNPRDLEFIKKIFGSDWSRLISLLWAMDKDEDLRNRVHSAVKARDREAMEDIYAELVGRKLVGKFRGLRTKSSNLTVVKLILDKTKRKFLNERTAI